MAGLSCPHSIAPTNLPKMEGSPSLPSILDQFSLMIDFLLDQLPRCTEEIFDLDGSALGAADFNVGLRLPVVLVNEFNPF